MLIRTASELDLESISALAEEIASLHSSSEPRVFAPPDAARDSEFWRSAIGAANGTVQVAEVNGRILGFITANVTQTNVATFLKTRSVCRIGTIVVAQRAHRRGIGKTLIQAIEVWAKSVGAVEIRLEVFGFNHQARAFYTSVGYGEQSLILRKGL